MQKEIERFGKICCKTQDELKSYLHRFLMSNGYKVVNEDGFLYAKGTLPYLVTAHMDTVHKEQCSRYSIHRFQGNHRIQSPYGIGGDDRCGIYMIVRMILDGYRPTVLFCEDEEIGSVGASKFTLTKYADELKELNYFIELDRANANDAVFYYCDNKEFKKYIEDNTGYKEAPGTWTDIVELSDATGIASVNFSCGYYNAHTTKEYVIFEEMWNTITVVERLMKTTSEQFDYMKVVTNERWCYSDYWDSYYDRLYGYDTEYKKEMVGMEICWNDTLTGKEEMVFIPGESEAECMYSFFYSYPYVCWNDVLDYTCDY